jgi:hypothetical protein
MEDLEMSEWQPARIRRVHQRGPGTVMTEELPDGKLVHVRPIEASGAREVIFREKCGGRKFYIKEMGCWICEHEILTD